MNSELSPDILACLKRALDEDIGSGDATTDSIVLPEARLSGEFVAKQAGIISGVNIAAQVFLLLDDPVNQRLDLRVIVLAEERRVVIQVLIVRLLDHGARAFCELLHDVDKFDVRRLAASPGGAFK